MRLGARRVTCRLLALLTVLLLLLLIMLLFRLSSDATLAGGRSGISLMSLRRIVSGAELTARAAPSAGSSDRASGPGTSSTSEDRGPDEHFEQQLAMVRQLLRRQADQMKAPPAAFTGEPVPERRSRQLLLVSSWRSGSSFVGQLLATQPLAFYVFEPLKWLLAGRNATTPEQRAAVLRELLRCNFSAIAQPEALTFSLRNAVPDAVCARLPERCRSRRLLEAACALHPVRVIKTVRVRVRYLEPLLRLSPRLSVVLLARDPRATVYSRRAQSSWCRHKCSSVPHLCRWLAEALREAAQLRREFPERVLTVLYEQLAGDVAGGTRQLFSALDVPLEEPTLRFLLQHTGQEERVAAELLGRPGQALPQNAVRISKEMQNPYSTYRNSSAAAVNWRRTMSFKMVSDVQEQCADAISLMGYRTFPTQAQLRNLTIPMEL